MAVLARDGHFISVVSHTRMGTEHEGKQKQHIRHSNSDKKSQLKTSYAALSGKFITSDEVCRTS